MVTGDGRKDVHAEGTGGGRDPLVSIEILEDPWTPAREVEQIASDVARKAQNLGPRL